MRIVNLKVNDSGCGFNVEVYDDKKDAFLICGTYRDLWSARRAAERLSVVAELI